MIRLSDQIHRAYQAALSSGSATSYGPSSSTITSPDPGRPGPRHFSR
jgi:hypothetical protein